MFWELALPVILTWTLCVSMETKKPRGSIPSPYKLKGNDVSHTSSSSSSSLARSLLPRRPSSRRLKTARDGGREGVVVTDRKNLKRDWCKTQPLRQRVSLAGCLSRTVINRFCYGQCNSFYIPRHLTSRTTSHRNRKSAAVSDHDASFQSCASCRPTRLTAVTVRLHCPGLQPPYRQRQVHRVKRCKCVSVDVNNAY